MFFLWGGDYWGVRSLRALSYLWVLRCGEFRPWPPGHLPGTSPLADPLPFPSPFPDTGCERDFNHHFISFHIISPSTHPPIHLPFRPSLIPEHPPSCPLRPQGSARRRRRPASPWSSPRGGTPVRPLPGGRGGVWRSLSRGGEELASSTQSKEITRKLANKKQKGCRS